MNFNEVGSFALIKFLHLRWPTSKSQTLTSLQVWTIPWEVGSSKSNLRKHNKCPIFRFRRTLLGEWIQAVFDIAIASIWQKTTLHIRILLVCHQSFIKLTNLIILFLYRVIFAAYYMLHIVCIVLVRLGQLVPFEDLDLQVTRRLLNFSSFHQQRSLQFLMHQQRWKIKSVISFFQNFELG